MQILKQFRISALLFTAANWMIRCLVSTELKVTSFVLHALKKPGRSDLFKHGLKITVTLTLDIVFFSLMKIII